MVKKLFILFGIISLGAQGISWAQPPTFRVTHVNNQVSLSHNTVTGVTLDSHGFLWISTMDGLNRYDGKSVRVYNHSENDSTSLSDGFIHGVYEYSADELWISTRDGGLNILNPITDKVEVINNESALNNGIPNAAISLLYKDAKGVFWLSFNRHSFGVFDRKQKKYTAARLIERNSGFEIGPVNGVLEFNDGSMIISSYSGLYYIPKVEIEGFRNKPTLGKTIKSNEILLKKGLAKPNISHTYLDKQAHIWIREVRDGFRRLEINELPAFALKSIASGLAGSSANGMVLENDEYVTVGGLNNEIVSIHKKTGRQSFQKINVAEGLTGLTNLFKDYKGNIWVGIWGAGLYLLEEEKGIELVNKKQLGQALKSNFILAFEEEENGYWIGTAQGLAFWDNEKKRLHSYEGKIAGFSGVGIWSIERDSSGLWVVGVEGGLNFIEASAIKNKKMLTARNFNAKNSFLKLEQLHQVFKDSRGWLWLGYEGAGVQIVTNTEDWQSGEAAQLIELDPRTSEMRISSDNIRKIYEDNNGDIWLATMDRGAIRIRINENKIGRIELFNYDENNSNSISYNDTRSIYQQNDSTFWFATYGGGVTKWVEPSNTFTRLKKEQGLPNNSTYSIISGHNNRFLWISTNSGLARLDTENMKFENYTESDGLQNLEFNTGAYLALKDGNLLFGGVNGFNRINPDLLSINSHKPPVFITEINLFNEPIKTDTSVLFKKELNLKYNENFISFEFAALDFKEPNQNQFAYRMLGVDDSWVFSGNRNYTSYPNLAEGNYIFEVKAANNDGIWNEIPAFVKVYISPPWWRTLWFKWLSGLVFIAITVSAIRYVAQRKLRIQIRKMEVENKLRNERERISRDLHDHVGAQLANIISGLSLVDKYNQRDEGKKAFELVSSLQGDAQNTITQLRDTIWALNQKELTVDVFMDHLKTYFKSQSALSSLLEIKYNVENDGENILSSTQALNVFRIVQEAAQNTLKYANASILTISMSCIAEQITLSIKDNGSFKKETNNYYSGYGLGNIRKRTEEMDGTFELLIENGTEIKIIFNL
ncbi:MAG: two-component regulator propeller domain-containing protein [Balneolaceae bacterium]